MSDEPTIIYTLTDEAPALATAAFLPVIRAFAKPAGVRVELADISVAGRILANFPDFLTPEQCVTDTLAQLGRKTLEPDANIIKLPNISASLPQLLAAIKELQGKGYKVPDYPEDPQSDEDRPNELGWASYPEGFRLALLKAHERYHLPLYVLENGTADSKDEDTDRQRLLVEHIRELFLAQKAGADIRGYFHWSLFDNFEWAEGFEARFGLVAVDYRDGFRRTPRPSAALYSRIIAERGLDVRLVDTWLSR